MKKTGAIFLIILLFIGFLSNQVMAAQTSDFDQQLTQYLSELSSARGFEVTNEKLEASLSYYYKSINDFESVQDMKNILGDVILADLSNLSSIYAAYDLDEGKLNQLLTENKKTLTDYVFLNELDTDVYFFTDDGTITKDPEFGQDFADYLVQVSTERGFPVTKENIEGSLSFYEMSTEDFETVKDLSDFLGEVVKPDLSNLAAIYKTYELDEQSFLQLLKNNDKEINDFIYLSDIEVFLWNTKAKEIPDISEVMDELLPFFDQIGLTEKELQQVADYFLSLEDYFSSKETQDKMTALAERVMTLAENVSPAKEPTEEQIKAYISLYHDILSLLRIKVIFSLNDDVFTLEELSKLKDLKSGDLKIAVYTTESKLLADVVLTQELIESYAPDLGNVIEDTTKEVIKNVTPVKPTHTTVNGGKLPKTASTYLPNAIYGILIVLAGFSLKKTSYFSNPDLRQ